jgi:hypothetical protein
MNSTDENTSRDTGQETAAGRAEAGTGGWEDAVRLQRWATPDHVAFYALGGEVVSTLYALDDLAQVLVRQVAGYGQGRRLYDDTRQVDPQSRLADAVGELAVLAGQLGDAARTANRFFSAVGHIGVEEDPS